MDGAAQGGGVLLLVLATLLGLIVFLFRRWRLLDALIEELNNFRGGPGTPTHPSSADDGALLRRRSRRIEN
jgi:hypothetical protein